ncbi:Cyclic nucleotide-gated cation channel beta-1, partial [Ophiophagus hannah]
MGNPFCSHPALFSLTAEDLWWFSQAFGLLDEGRKEKGREGGKRKEGRREREREEGRKQGGKEGRKKGRKEGERRKGGRKKGGEGEREEGRRKEGSKEGREEGRKTKEGNLNSLPKCLLNMEDEASPQATEQFGPILASLQPLIWSMVKAPVYKAGDYGLKPHFSHEIQLGDLGPVTLSLSAQPTSQSCCCEENKKGKPQAVPRALQKMAPAAQEPLCKQPSFQIPGRMSYRTLRVCQHIPGRSQPMMNAPV